MANELATKSPEKSPASAFFWFFDGNPALDYWLDAWQRSILLLDVLRQRGNNYLEYNAREMPLY